MAYDELTAKLVSENTTLRAEIERLRDVVKTAIRQFEDGNLLSCHRTLCDEVYGRQT
jgi:regulator of replication initiation timing